MPNGGLFVAALISLLLGLYTLVFRRDALQYFSKTVRYLFWAYLAVAAIVVIWSAVGFITAGFPD